MESPPLHERIPSPESAVSLCDEPIHLSAPLGATRVQGFSPTEAGFHAYMAAFCTPQDPGRLILMEHSAEDWASWERHLAGDEVVVVTSGVAELIQEIGGKTRSYLLRAGDAIVNPAGVWHTANVREPFSAIYITPCPGTEHRPRSGGDRMSGA